MKSITNFFMRNNEKLRNCINTGKALNYKCRINYGYIQVYNQVMLI